MSEELKITKERVLEAASKCGTAKEVLKTLWPDVFHSKEFDLTKLKIKLTEDAATVIYDGYTSNNLIAFYRDGTFIRLVCVNDDIPIKRDRSGSVLEK